ncbi:MAG: hypothetical protein D6723_14355 [Acidobacteria bacterium]|nr:MAG: hypothetical protein D6723_14355 [Acidobacteriota bacterium]
MSRDWLGLIRRGLRKPPRVILQRLGDELWAELERFLAPARARRMTGRRLARLFGLPDLDALWVHLGQNSYVSPVGPVDADTYDQLCPGDAARIIQQAERALQHEVDLLGSGPVSLGEKVDWLKDYKTGIRWPRAYIRSIEYNNPDQPSDVKFPWELSRLQWVIPAGQAYLLTGDEKYAVAVRDLLSHWIEENPYAGSVNWACTMEVAMRILSWSWLFHVFRESAAWRDSAFRERFLCTLYLHGDFTARHLERSDINGNHYTADAAGLVFAGLFFAGSRQAARWLNTGWGILQEELPRQVTSDGVDFEGSVAYHRLVLELFFLPALYREKRGYETPQFYRDRLIAMAHFTEAYTQPDGNAPLIGDADDARALPFGGQGVNDHRYLLGIVATAWHVNSLKTAFSGSRAEIFWLLGIDAAKALPERNEPAPGSSIAFPEGGYYVLRQGRDHVFVDCAPVGLSGRGGHGHNDCLSFEAVLAGTKLISDCGAYLYTSSYEARNRFRSTTSHNTPIVDGEEINRFIRPDYLWNLHYDARPEVLVWEPGEETTVLRASHRGYLRLMPSVRIERTVILDHVHHELSVTDLFEGEGEHRIEIPLHLAPGVTAECDGNEGIILKMAEEKLFRLRWQGQGFDLRIDEGWVSPSYGRIIPVVRLAWHFRGMMPASLSMSLTIENS